MAKAKVNIPWLPMRVIVSRAARHLGCAVTYARLRIVQEAEAGGRIRACGLTVEGWPMSPLPAAWRGVDWDADVDLRLDGLIVADLLPASAERAEWPAVLALAYIIEGMPLEWKEWTADMVRQAERTGIDLGEAIGADQVLAWGRLTPQGPMEQIPGSDLRIPGFVWVVRPDGELGTSPPGQLAVFQGRRWYGIEAGSATFRQAFPKPLRVERRMLVEAEQLYAESWPEPATRAEELMPEPAQAIEPESASPSLPFASGWLARLCREGVEPSPPEPELAKAEPEPVSDGEPEPGIADPPQADSVSPDAETGPEESSSPDKQPDELTVADSTPGPEMHSHDLARPPSEQPGESTVSSAAGETTPAPAPVADASAPVANTEAPVILKQNAETASSASAASSPTAPQTESASPAESKQPAPRKAVKRRRRPGPRRGTIARFALADRALFPEMTTLIEQQHITPGEAARKLSGKIAGRGNDDSKARRLAKRYRAEVEKLTTTRRDS